MKTLIQRIKTRTKKQTTKPSRNPASEASGQAQQTTNDWTMSPTDALRANTVSGYK